MTPKKVKSFLSVKISKQKKNNNNQDANKLSIKMSKIMFALAALSADEENFAIKFNIFTFIIYTEAVKNSI